MKDEIIVYTASDRDSIDWNNYIRTKDIASCFNRYEWKSVISNIYKVDQHYLIARREGVVCGILPTYLLNSGWGQYQLHSMKNGFISDDHMVANSLIDHLSEKIKTINNLKVNTSSPYVFSNANFQSEKKIILALELKENIEDMWSSLRSKTRNVIRKSQRNALTLKKGAKYLEIFYAIYSDRMARKVIPFSPCRFFSQVLETFSNKSQIYIAEKDGKAIAGILMLYSGNTATYAYSAYLPGAEKYCSIHFLMWELIKDCIERRFSLIDMGESTVGSGVYNFKIWMGAKPKVIYYYQPIIKQNNKRKSRFYINAALSRMELFTISNIPISLRKPILVRKKQRRSLI